MKRLFCMLVFFLLADITSAQAQQSSARPNVLFIFVDDLRPELGCYGNQLIRTPNLDQLASQSLRFNNHYVQVPTCGASRYSLLTGMLPKSQAHLNNNAIERFISGTTEDDYPNTFIHHLKRNGYHTVGIGKISHSADGLLYPYTGSPEGAARELPYAWDELLFNHGKWGTGWNAFFGYADGSNRQSMDKKVKPYEKGPVEDDGYVDGLTANLAVDKIEALAASKAPFFLGVGFFKPHLPFTAPQKYWDLYEEAQLPLTPSPNLPEDVNAASFHNSNEFKSYEAGEEKPSLMHPVSNDYARKITHAYYAAVSYVDAQIGKVLTALEQNGLAENTIVVVWSDHGWQLGDHRVWGKHTLSERALRSVLMIKYPGMRSPGRTSEDIVSTVDIYPTLTDLCGIGLARSVDGESFAKLFTRRRLPGWKDAAYSYFNDGITVRTKKFRLTRYFRDEQPVVELYHHRRDPFENHNIAEKRPGKVRRLMKVLEKGNTGLYGEEGI